MKRQLEEWLHEVNHVRALLIDELGTASRAGRPRDATAAWLEPHLLVIDEIGYPHHAEDAANVLFWVVDQRYLARKPMIFTTNKKLRVGQRPSRP